jgi:uncharacterized protein YdhG (YjbR/CyaY superfamily)
MMNTAINSIAEYIATFPQDKRELLEQVRALIHEAAPTATEAMSYGMPTFKLNGNLIHFAAFKEHLGIYPGPEAIEVFKTDLAKFETSKGAIRIPYTASLPVKLIQKITEFRVAVSLAKKQ